MINYYQKRKPKEYALYKGDKFLAMGTVKELAKKMGITENTIRLYHSIAHKKRNYKNCRILIDLEE